MLTSAITYIELDVAVLAKVVGVFLPITVALITTKMASSKLKGTVLFFLAAVSGLVVTLIEADGKIPLAQLADASITTVVTAVAFHYGLWKPTEVTRRVQDATPNLGLGGKSVLASTEWPPSVEGK